MITAGKDGVYIDIQVQPRARRPGVRGIHGQRLRIAVAEPPEGGRANMATVQAVADLLNSPSKAVSLVAGATSRQKRLFVRGVGPDDALERIAAALGASGTI